MNKSSDAPAESASFRDPSGFIFRHNGTVYRQINPNYKECYEYLVSSGLYNELVDKHLLIPHQETKVAGTAGAYNVLKPRQLDILSYPYEWSFSMLQDAALATLEIQKIALDHGMSLKDASAYNIQWVDGKPTLIDTLSFEFYEERPWVAYRQFCQHFLAPLAVMAMNDIRLQRLLRDWIDGLPLDLAVSLLPARARLNLGLFMHLYAHAGSQKKHAKPTTKELAKPVRMPRRSLDGLLDSLQSTVAGLKWQIPQTEWADYYSANNNYQDKAMQAKHKLVLDLGMTVNPGSVWDLGGNTGEFSRLFSEKGIPTVCWDIDPVAVEMNYREVKKNEEPKLWPLMQDFTNPSPPIGWNGEERQSLFERGQADLVLALALIHHMAIANNVPLAMVANFMHRLTKKALVIEFIPKEDSQVQKLLASREDIFRDYTKEGFESAFSQYFKIKESKHIQQSKRWLYLMTVQ